LISEKSFRYSSFITRRKMGIGGKSGRMRLSNCWRESLIYSCDAIIAYSARAAWSPAQTTPHLRDACAHKHQQIGKKGSSSSTTNTSFFLARGGHFAAIFLADVVLQRRSLFVFKWKNTRRCCWLAGRPTHPALFVFPSLVLWGGFVGCVSVAYSRNVCTYIYIYKIHTLCLCVYSIVSILNSSFFEFVRILSAGTFDC
jgi:hypothetical protein